MIRKYCEWTVIGNHDLFAIRKLSLHFNDFSYPKNWYDLSFKERRELSSGRLWLYENEFLEKELHADEIGFLSKLPEFLIIEIDSHIIHISHSIYPDLTGSNFFRLHNTWELKTHFEWLSSNGARYSFSGHMHSRYPLRATYDKIVEMQYKKHTIKNEIIQFVAPCVAKGRGKSGVIIADIKNKEIEAIEINKLFENKLFSFYGRKEKRINFKKFFLNIILPTLLSIMLFIVLIFWYIIPYFESNLLNSNKEMIRELVNSTLSIANKNYSDYKAGMLTEEEAKNDDIEKIKYLRYGIELKDYFFITDMQPFMIMHPYRPDLNGNDLSNFLDPNDKAVFVEMVEKIKISGEGFVDYKWQWMDDSIKIVPKISYVAEFKPWGWVIGTGIYIGDVREKIAEIESGMIFVSIIISSIIGLLLTAIVLQNFSSEKKRSIAEKELMISKEKYKTLVEASTEGTAMILGGELIYSN